MPLYAGGQQIAKLYRGGVPIARAYRGGTLVLGGAAAPFSPLDIAGLALWLDAADTATITDAGGGAVSAWADKSGLGRDFVQATAADRPTTGASTLNGKNVIDFDGDFLVSSAAASTWTFMHDATGSTVFLVVRLESHTDQLELLGTQDGSAENGYSVWGRPNLNDTVFHAMARGVSGQQVVSNLTGNNFFVQGTWFILEVASDPSNAAAADRSSLIKNGGAAVKNNSLTNAPSNSDPTRNLGIGKIANDSRRLKGSIAEIVIYSDSKTVSERGAVRAWLSSKWGIVVA